MKRKKRSAPHEERTNLTPEQQILMRVVLNGGTPIRTILHNGRMHEVIYHAAPLREIQPWFESNGTSSNSASYWIKFHRDGVPMPVRSIYRRLAYSRLSSAPMWTGEPRPKGRSANLRTRFPSGPDLRRLVQELGYDKRAAMAALPQSYTRFLRAGGRYSGTNRQELVAGQPLYFSTDIRHTTVGGGLTEEQVRKGLSRMRADGRVGKALLEIVYKRRSTKKVAEEFDLKPENLHVYASRLRGHIRRQQQGIPSTKAA